MTVKLILLLVFVAATIAIGIYSRKKATDVNQFVLGGRSIGPWMSAFAYGTTYFSAVMFVGFAGQFGWKFGLSATWVGIGNAIIGSMLAWLILARRTRIMTHHLDSATMPDFFSKRYNSKGIKLAASAILFVFLIPYTASLYNGLSRIFGMAFNIDYSVCIVAMAVLTAIYVILGGYLATAINDFIQGIIMLGGVVAVVLAVINGQGGFSHALTALSQVPTATGKTGAFTSLFGPDPVNLFAVVILTSLATWGLPQMVHKFYAIKDEKSIAKGTIISTIFAVVISAGCFFMGGFGRLFDSSALYSKNVVVFDRIVPSMLSTLPDILIGIVVILVLSASMSTLAALVMTSSSSLTLDFIKGTVVKNMTEKKQVLTIRILLAVFILISALLALFQYKSTVTFIAQLMSISWGALAGSFLGPFIYGLYWKRVTRPAVWTSFIVGVGLTVLNMILKFFIIPSMTAAGISVSNTFIGFISSPIITGVITMLLSLVIIPVVSLITKKPDAQQIESIFSCFDKKAVK
ncbi:sodium:solute symporter [Oscillospiraceae bacterium CM]|nr:sodium:solute symporter [Oscillospiraceae bacterium CM]